MTVTKPPIEYRSDWGALPKKSNPGGFTDLTATVCHYTAANPGYAVQEWESHEECREQVRAIQRQHQAITNQSDIEYNALCCNHGTLFEGRELGIKGGANGNADSNATMPSCCCLLGVDDQPSDKLLNAISWFHMRVEQRAGRKLEMFEHGDIYNTSCPGNPMAEFVQNDVYRHMIDSGSTPTPTPPGDDDMPAPDIVQINAPWGPFPQGAVMICSPDCMTFRWVKSEDELWQLQQTFARRGWTFPNPIPPIPPAWLAQYGELIGATP